MYNQLFSCLRREKLKEVGGCGVSGRTRSGRALDAVCMDCEGENTLDLKRLELTVVSLFQFTGFEESLCDNIVVSHSIQATK